MKLGIVGLPNVGKSTLFNAITQAGAESANYPFCTIEPNVGTVAVPDERLDKLAEMYEKEKFKLITRDEYIDIVCDQLEYLREDIVVNRITGDPKVSDLIEPDWLIKKVTILNDIDKEMTRRNSYQGIKYKK